MIGSAGAPLLDMRGIGKAFPGVQALSNVDLQLQRGEALALLGENGAGKSTLIRILAGAHSADAGTIRIDGEPVELGTPVAADRAGIAVIHQEFCLIPDLPVRENLFLGRETTRAMIPHADERRRAAAIFDRIGVSLPTDRLCRDLTVAQQQLVEIARALSQEARILVMDEPSAAISPREVERLFDVIRDLRSQGLGIIYISHRLEEIFAIADRVTVLRDGQAVANAAVRELNRRQLIELMVGRDLEHEFPPREASIGDVRFRAAGLRNGTAVRDVSLEIRRGEILGLTGLVGAGRTETARLIFGADRAEAGTLSLDGVPLRIRSPRDAIRAGICLLTEDRKHQGLILDAGIRENFSLPSLAAFATMTFVSRRRERQALKEFSDRLRIRAVSSEQAVGTLSGGNQQKVVLARWLMRSAEVIIFDEPTRGIDVGAKFEIYQLMQRLAAAGKAILMISSELPEVLGMSDRILVMHDGRITGEITDVEHATQEQVFELAVR